MKSTSPALTMAGALGLAFLQTTLFTGRLRPDLVLVWVVALSLACGSTISSQWAFWSGLFLDILSAAPFGVFTLSLLLVSFLVSLGESTIYRTSLFLPLLAGLMASTAYYLLLFFFLNTLGWQVPWWPAWHLVGLNVLVNTALMPLAYKVAEACVQRAESRV
ncbi:MAG: rod shape-determining protein MreD [Ardenticatenia bacterium]|nr:rod shape-determining protein MreD [Ardenticatenia bacterium]